MQFEGLTQRFFKTLLLIEQAGIMGLRSEPHHSIFALLQLLQILVALFFKFLEHWISINGSGRYAVGEKWDVI